MKSSIVAIKTVTSWPVLVLWSMISIVIGFLCCWCYSHPAWTIRSSQIHHQVFLETNVINHTNFYMDHELKRQIRAVTTHFDSTDQANEYNLTTIAIPTRNTIPFIYIGLFGICIYTRMRQSMSTCVSHSELDYEWLPPPWQVTRVLCGAGCVFLMVCAITSISTLFLRRHRLQHKFVKFTGILQLVAAFFMLMGLCFYPFGLQWENLVHLCNDHCHPGWSSLVSGLCSVAAFLCPILASLVFNPIYDVNPWEAYLLL